MVQFVLALIVLAAVGVLLWKAVSAQALAAGNGSGEDDAPTGPTRRPGAGRPTRSAPIAPDDDPEFLRSLDEQVRRSRGSDHEDPPAAS